MIGNKIKALLNLTNKNTSDICNALGILEAAYYRKIERNTFKTEELIKIAELTNSTLKVCDNETGKTLIEFSKEDL